MDRLILILGFAMLLVFAAITWVGPRRYGWTGLVAVHLVVFFSYFVIAGVSLSAGVYEYDGALSTIGLALQAFLSNSLLLPLGLIAIRRRRQVGRS